MESEISRLGLPRGIWQGLIKEAVPDVAQVICEYPDDRTMVMKCYDLPYKMVVTFSMSFLYGNRGILVSHAMEVDPAYRGKGIATALQPVKERIAKDLKVSLLMATVRAENAPEKAVIKDWHLVDTFTNIRTGAEIDVYTKHID